MKTLVLILGWILLIVIGLVVFSTLVLVGLAVYDELRDRWKNRKRK